MPENLNVALILNGRLVFARSVAFGGKNFTEALAQSLNFAHRDAERVKIARGGLDERVKKVPVEVVAPLRNVAGRLLGALQSSMKFAETQTGVELPALSRIVLPGRRHEAARPSARSSGEGSARRSSSSSRPALHLADSLRSGCPRDTR